MSGVDAAGVPWFSRAARRSAASCLSSACLVESDAICAARRSAELGRRFVGCTDTVTLCLAAITVSSGHSTLIPGVLDHLCFRHLI